MRKKSKRTTGTFIIVFILAFMASFLLVQLLPIPGEHKQLIFFIMIPLISFAGVFISARRKRR